MLAQIEASKIGTLTDEHLDKVKDRVAIKNGYEKVCANTYVKQHWVSRFMEFSSKGRQNMTSARAYFESSHAVTAALLRVQHQRNQDNSIEQDKKSVWEAFKESSYLQSRAKRQDHVRFREAMQSVNSKQTEAGKLVSARNSRQNRISRIFGKLSHVFTGICEMTSAPTGFTFKALRNLLYQGIEENGLTNMAATGMASAAIGVCTVTALGAMRNEATASSLAEHAATALISFATVSGVAGGISAVCTGVAALTAPNIELNPAQKAMFEENVANTLGKINDLVLALRQSPDGLQQLARALNRKIGPEYRAPLEAGQKHALPQLLKDLVDQLVPQLTEADQMTNLRKTMDIVGAYMNQIDPIDVDTATTFQRHAYRQKVRTLEKHFMALAGMVEHITPTCKTLQTTIDKDARLWCEDKAKELNRGFLTRLKTPAKYIDSTFGTQLVKQLERWANSDIQNIRKAELKKPEDAQQNCTDSEYMIANIHQYGPITRRLIRAALFIHAINYHYVLAVNAQSSRVYGNLTKAADELVSTNHACRLGHAGVGRFLGGASVSAMYTFGIGGIEVIAGTSAATSVGLGSATMAIFNTGTMMTGVGLLSAGAMLCAKLMVRVEGWHGNAAAKEGNPAFSPKTKRL